ncbi:hypothetical protein EYR41_006856 [Orbilia oligospora]|uniref:Uncharacterized protein n=1 Tax=Orbilia oligospora TaxID=2813651 RepID=A0A8H2DV58_ORBOL|nr:hypothetical protein EYR41_006856 [Orbilia oligospora]
MVCCNISNLLHNRISKGERGLYLGTITREVRQNSEADIYISYEMALLTCLPDFRYGCRPRFRLESTLSKRRISKGFMYAKKLSSASKKIGKHLDNGDIVNVKPWLYWMAADIVGELYFGKDFGMLENEANSINGYRFGTPFRYSS